jgi:hypothetical protein
MRQKFAPLQSGLAPFHGFNEAVFLLEIPRNKILHSLIELASLLGRSLREFRLQVGVEMNFHAPKIRENRPSGNAFERRRYRWITVFGCEPLWLGLENRGFRAGRFASSRADSWWSVETRITTFYPSFSD